MLTRTGLTVTETVVLPVRRVVSVTRMAMEKTRVWVTTGAVHVTVTHVVQLIVGLESRTRDGVKLLPRLSGPTQRRPGCRRATCGVVVYGGPAKQRVAGRW